MRPSWTALSATTPTALPRRSSSPATSRTSISRRPWRRRLTCAAAGVKGLEVYYTYDKNRPYYKDEPLISKDELAELVEHYASLAEQHGLLKTGGTDFHGATKPQIEVGEVDARYALVEALKAARP